MAGKKCSVYLPPTNLVTEEDIILLGDSSTHNPVGKWKNEHKRENAVENPRQIQFFVPNYYREYDGCKLTIDLTLDNLTLSPDNKWSKKYKLSGSDLFPIIIEDERKVPTKQNQRWSIERTNGMQFQRERKITTRVWDWSTIEEARSSLVKTILQATEKTISRDKEKTTSSIVEQIMWKGWENSESSL